MNKLYEGVRDPQGNRITVDGRPLPMRNDLRDHSPDGYVEFAVMPTFLRIPR
jgi:hypothetical protein